MSKRKLEVSSAIIYGEGDSNYQYPIFSPDETKEILRELDEQIVYLPREQFRFRILNSVSLLPRDKAFYGDVTSDGIYPLFRYESGKDVVYPDVKAWPPVLQRLRDTIEEITGQYCNHCVVNQYRGEELRRGKRKDLFLSNR